MAKSIKELENDLDTMNEMFRKYVKLSLDYQKQINNAGIPEEQRKALMERLETENEKVRKAKQQIEKFERTIETLKNSNDKLKQLASCKKEHEFLVAYN
ncbi:MAG: hypothetical protein QCH31_01760 [Methanolobus sp.]|nr:hypothetical protein [Methanolobus sp.]